MDPQTTYVIGDQETHQVVIDETLVVDNNGIVLDNPYLRNSPPKNAYSVRYVGEDVCLFCLCVCCLFVFAPVRLFVHLSLSLTFPLSVL